MFIEVNCTRNKTIVIVNVSAILSAIPATSHGGATINFKNSRYDSLQVEESYNEVKKLIFAATSSSTMNILETGRDFLDKAF